MADENQNKRKGKKGKIAFMFAFAVTVLGSRGLSAAASTVPVADGDYGIGNETAETEQQSVGSNPDYQRLAPNVYLATEQAQAVNDFVQSLKPTHNFAVFANNFTNSHLEGNMAVGNTNSVYSVYGNVIDHHSNNDEALICYVANPPEDNMINMFGHEGSKFELVLGFDFELVNYGNTIGFACMTESGPKMYRTEYGSDKLTIRRATEDDVFANINKTLDNIADIGDKLIKATEFSAEDSADTLKNAIAALTYNDVTAGQIMVINVAPEDLCRNETEGYLQQILSNEKGVKIIVNVIANENTNNINFSNVNAGNWNENAPNVIYNFGSYIGNIYAGSQNAGTIVAPYANVSHLGNFIGAIIADSTSTSSSEIHQVTAPTDNTPQTPSQPQTPTPTPTPTPTNPSGPSGNEDDDDDDSDITDNGDNGGDEETTTTTPGTEGNGDGDDNDTGFETPDNPDNPPGDDNDPDEEEHIDPDEFGDPDGEDDGQPDDEDDGEPDGEDDGQPDDEDDGEPDGEDDGQPDDEDDGEPDDEDDGQPDDEDDGQPDDEDDGEPDESLDDEPTEESSDSTGSGSVHKRPTHHSRPTYDPPEDSDDDNSQPEELEYAEEHPDDDYEAAYEDIPDDGIPRGDMNMDDDPTFDIPDDGVPRGDMDMEDDPTFNIPDDGVPRGDMDMPDTGGQGSAMGGLALGAAGAAAAMALAARRKKENNK